jgi:hypothetical protein
MTLIDRLWKFVSGSRLLHDLIGHVAGRHVPRNGLLALSVRPNFVRSLSGAQVGVTVIRENFDDLGVVPIHAAQGNMDRTCMSAVTGALGAPFIDNSSKDDAALKTSR